jgi:hypothetical protein
MPFRHILDPWVFTHIGVLYPEFASQLFDLLLWIVRFNERISLMKMDQEFFVCIKKFIATYSHTSFDIVHFGVLRVTKDDDVFSLWSWTFYQVTVTVKVWKKGYLKPRQMWGRDTV